MSKKKLGGIAAGALKGVFGRGDCSRYTLSPRVTEREAGLKIVRGSLVDSNVSTGVKMYAILPHV